MKKIIILISMLMSIMTLTGCSVKRADIDFTLDAAKLSNDDTNIIGNVSNGNEVSFSNSKMRNIINNDINIMVDDFSATFDFIYNGAVELSTGGVGFIDTNVEVGIGFVSYTETVGTNDPVLKYIGTPYLNGTDIGFDAEKLTEGDDKLTYSPNIIGEMVSFDKSIGGYHMILEHDKLKSSISADGTPTTITIESIDLIIGDGSPWRSNRFIIEGTEYLVPTINNIGALTNESDFSKVSGIVSLTKNEATRGGFKFDESFSSILQVYKDMYVESFALDGRELQINIDTTDTTKRMWRYDNVLEGFTNKSFNFNVTYKVEYYKYDGNPGGVYPEEVVNINLLDGGTQSINVTLPEDVDVTREISVISNYSCDEGNSIIMPYSSINSSIYDGIDDGSKALILIETSSLKMYYNITTGDITYNGGLYLKYHYYDVDGEYIGYKVDDPTSSDIIYPDSTK